MNVSISELRMGSSCFIVKSSCAECDCQCKARVTNYGWLIEEMDMPDNVWNAPDDQLFSILDRHPPPPKVWSSIDVSNYTATLSRGSDKQMKQEISNYMETKNNTQFSKTSEKEDGHNHGTQKLKKRKLIFGRQLRGVVNTSKSTKLNKK